MGLMPMGKLRMKLCLAIREKNNLKLSFIALGKCGPGDLLLNAPGRCVLHFYRRGSADLNSIVEISAGCHAVGPKARSRVINFKKLNRSARTILYRNADVI